MRKLFIAYMLFLPAMLVHGQVFIGTESTGNPVLLEVKSTNQGILIPRINIPDTLSASPVNSPKEGLLVVNTHQNKEGLYFWGGSTWEKLKTVTAADEELNHTGKKVVFIGMSNPSTALVDGAFNKIAFTTSYINGNLAVPSDAYIIPAGGGLYEITASFTGKTNSGNEAFYALMINNYMDNTKRLSRTTGNQIRSYTSISAKTTYCGLFKGNEYIGVLLYYKKLSGNVPLPTVEVNISIKKVTD
ncbi:MAG: hypothetical protein LBK65_01015 [Tannerellaceae bacterium]|jgi:hypothetical protein|nr:hypothetical protein [Tannerellaceae bacterium]